MLFLQLLTTSKFHYDFDNALNALGQLFAWRSFLGFLVCLRSDRSSVQSDAHLKRHNKWQVTPRPKTVNAPSVGRS